MAKLNLLTGPRAGESLEIEHEQTIGRGEVDIVIDDPKLSRRHAAVRPAEGGIEIEDLGSLNGTFVEGERLSQPRMLRGGESVRLGDTTLGVEKVTAGEPTVFATPPESGATVLEPTAPPVAEPPPSRVAEPPFPPPPAAPPPPGPPARAPATAGGYHPVATLLWGPTVLCLAIILAVAVAEVVYFAAR